MKHTIGNCFWRCKMAKLHFNLDNKKYIMEFLPGNRVKIKQLDSNKFITVHYSADTKVTDFMKCVKSWDFSKLKDNELYTIN